MKIQSINLYEMYRIIDDKKYKKVLTILNYNDIVLLVLKKRTKQVRKKTKKSLD